MDHGTYPLCYIDHQNVHAYTHSLDGVHICVEVGALHIRICNVQIACWPLGGENFKWEHMKESQIFFD